MEDSSPSGRLCPSALSNFASTSSFNYNLLYARVEDGGGSAWLANPYFLRLYDTGQLNDDIVTNIVSRHQQRQSISYGRKSLNANFCDLARPTWYSGREDGNSKYVFVITNHDWMYVLDPWVPD